jgi:hypothetical protein
VVKCSIETQLNDTLWYPGCSMIANIYISELSLGCVIGAGVDSSVELAMIVRRRK